MPFWWELVQRAWSSTVASMGTTSLAVSGALLYPLSELYGAVRKNGWTRKVLSQHWRERLRNSVVIALVWWGILFSYHLFYKIPKAIRSQAANMTIPTLRFPDNLPSNWDVRWSEQSARPQKSPPGEVPPPPGEPLSFAVEVELISPGFGDFIGYWLRSQGPGVCYLDSIDDLIFFRVTNTQPIPKTIINYAAEIQLHDKKWYPMKRLDLMTGTTVLTLSGDGVPAVGRTLQIPSSGESNAYPIMTLTTVGVNLKKAAIVQFPVFDRLIGGQTLKQGETARGWAGFQFPAVPDGTIRIKITDEAGKVHLVMPTVTKSSDEGDEDPFLPRLQQQDISPHLIQIGSLIDVSGCTQRIDFKTLPALEIRPVEP